MKKVNLRIAIILAIGAMTTNIATAAGGGNGGNGGNGGGEKGSTLGDLVVLYRNASGIPILTADKCQQPLAAPGAVADCTNTTSNGSCVLPVDPLTCAVLPEYATYLQPVDFGRMSVSRAPASVMAQQLGDVLVNLSTAQCLSLDPAGRIVFTTPDATDSDGDGDTTELISSAVDSPLQNLAIYKELMTTGTLGVPAISLPSAFPGYDFLDTAAKSLGAASDKEGKISVDTIVYLNQILGLSNKTSTSMLPKICISIKEEVKGAMQDVEKCFLNYGAFDYARGQTYSKLPSPAYIPAGAPIAGTMEFLDLYTGNTPPPTLFWIATGQITTNVFKDQPGYTYGDIGGFAQAADDARAVIDFTHSHPVLSGYQTAVPCTATTPSPLGNFDVGVDQFQMPIRMVADGEREGTVSIVNNGPDAASGQVLVNGTDSRGFDLSQSFDFSSLPAGESQAFTIVFTGPSYSSKIEWTATVVAAGDVLKSNNTLSATTQVLAKGGSSSRSASKR